ncbi:MAG: TM1266 family iron-only hydrogenase system putative regulator [Eggerthellaceae bacterium]
MDSEKKMSGRPERADHQVDTGVALIGVLVQNESSVPHLNDILHEYRDCIVGRMGVPYKEKHVSVISLIVDAPSDMISSLAGRIGMLDGVSSKTIRPKIDKGDGGH